MSTSIALKLFKIGPTLHMKMRPSYISFKRWAHTNKDVVVHDPFNKSLRKDKKTYIEMIKVFENQDTRRRGHVEFIYAALKQMQEFGVHKDLEAYKSLLEIFPQGKFIPTNLFQAEFMHYPKQQQCAVDLLEQMEDNGVIPDSEMELILLNVFGSRGIPLRKFWRMMYWMPKFRNLSPWYLPLDLPKEILELAKLAIERISSVDADRRVDVFQTEEVEAALDHTWIVSAQSPAQRILLAEQPPDDPLVVQGPYKVHLRDQFVTYFSLIGAIREEAKIYEDSDDVSRIEVPGAFGSPNVPSVETTVHEQDDGTVLALCATGTSSRDSLLSWIRLLEKNGNPSLAHIPVIFTLTAPPADVTVQEAIPAAKEQITAE